MTASSIRSEPLISTGQLVEERIPLLLTLLHDEAPVRQQQQRPRQDYERHEVRPRGEQGRCAEREARVGEGHHQREPECASQVDRAKPSRGRPEDEDARTGGEHGAGSGRGGHRGEAAGGQRVRDAEQGVVDETRHGHPEREERDVEGDPQWMLTPSQQQRGGRARDACQQERVERGEQRVRSRVGARRG